VSDPVAGGRDRAPWRCRAPALPLTLTLPLKLSLTLPLTLSLTLMLSAAVDRRHEPLSKPHIGISLD
jgi:hypothetical protein